MPDWPISNLVGARNQVFHSGGPGTFYHEFLYMANSSFSGSGAWPAANLAIYMPFLVETPVTAYKMAFEVGAQAGNCDVGIYDQLGNRLVSKGSTPVGPAGLQVIDITDTALTPGVYFMAMNVDTTTTLTIARVAPASGQWQQIAGHQQQAVGAVTLPDPATFANPGQGFLPSLAVACRSVI